MLARPERSEETLLLRLTRAYQGASVAEPALETNEHLLSNIEK
jgi:hypothetical protein